MPIAECELRPVFGSICITVMPAETQQGAQVVLLAVAASEQAQDARLMLSALSNGRCTRRAFAGYADQAGARCWRAGHRQRLSALRHRWHQAWP